MVKDRDWAPQTLESMGSLNDEPIAPVPSPAEPSGQAKLVNVNTATERELRTLPGVGAATARRIIGGRPYRDVDGLLTIKGINEKNLEAMRSVIMVE